VIYFDSLWGGEMNSNKSIQVKSGSRSSDSWENGGEAELRTRRGYVDVFLRETGKDRGVDMIAEIPVLEIARSLEQSLHHTLQDARAARSKLARADEKFEILAQVLIALMNFNASDSNDKIKDCLREIRACKDLDGIKLQQILGATLKTDRSRSESLFGDILRDAKV
jgi:hypothetical protein